MKDFIIVYNNSLYHTGILGMKWGKRNGPPYPLSGNAHSASEKKAGKKGWTKEAKKEKLKKIGKIAGATAAAAGSATLGAVAAKKQISDKITRNPNHKRGQSKVKEAPKSGDKQNGFNPTTKDNVKLINKVVSGTTQPVAKALRTASKETRPTGLKPASEMSNKELQDFLNRKNLEERYEKYTKQTVITRPGLKTAADAIEAIGGLAITTLSAVYLAKQIKDFKR